MSDADDLFSQVPPLPASDFFRILLKRHLPVVCGLGSEKTRSEMIIAPRLVERRGQSAHRLAIFSGSEFSVGPDQGLYGFCDFLVSRSPTMLPVTAPVPAVVGTKREGLTAGAAQCIAEMHPTPPFNARDSEPHSPG